MDVASVLKVLLEALIDVVASVDVSTLLSLVFDVPLVHVVDAVGVAVAAVLCEESAISNFLHAFCTFSKAITNTGIACPSRATGRRTSRSPPECHRVGNSRRHQY